MKKNYPSDKVGAKVILQRSFSTLTPPTFGRYKQFDVEATIIENNLDFGREFGNIKYFYKTKDTGDYRIESVWYEYGYPEVKHYDISESVMKEIMIVLGKQ